MNKPKVKQQSKNIPHSQVEMICNLAIMEIKLQRANIMDTLSSSKGGNEKSLLRLITKCLLECLAFLVKFKLANITKGCLSLSEDFLWDISDGPRLLKHLVTGIREIRDYSASLSRLWAAEEMKVSVYNDLPSYVKVYTTLEHRPLHTLLPKILEKKSVDLWCYKQTKRKTLLALSKEFVRLDNIFRNFWGSNADLNDFLSVQYGKIAGKPVAIETQPVSTTHNIASRELRSSLKQYLSIDYFFKLFFFRLFFFFFHQQFTFPSVRISNKNFTVILFSI